MTRKELDEAKRLARGFKPRKGLVANDSDIAEVGADSIAFEANRNDLRPADVPGARVQQIASGTGFFITEKGFLITNEHVVSEAPPRRWTGGGEPEKGKPPCPRKPNRSGRPTTLSLRNKPCSW